LAIPISRFALVTVTLQRRKSMARHFLRCRANAKILTGNPMARMGKRFCRPHPEAADRQGQTDFAKARSRHGFACNLRLFSGLFTIPAQKFVIALIDSFRSHP